jgi:hypothetical protein
VFSARYRTPFAIWAIANTGSPPPPPGASTRPTAETNERKTPVGWYQPVSSLMKWRCEKRRTCDKLKSCRLATAQLSPRRQPKSCVRTDVDPQTLQWYQCAADVGQAVRRGATVADQRQVHPLPPASRSPAESRGSSSSSSRRTVGVIR